MLSLLGYVCGVRGSSHLSSHDLVSHNLFRVCSSILDSIQFRQASYGKQLMEHTVHVGALSCTVYTDAPVVLHDNGMGNVQN